MAPTLRSWIVAGTLGTSLALLFDGDQGRRRRDRLLEHVHDLIEFASRNAGHKAKKVTDAVYDNAQEKIRGQRPRASMPDDNTLRDRIESEAFARTTAPRGEYNVNVENGIAVLRGQLPTQDDIQMLIGLVSEVADVRGVESFLHTPGTPAPNKVSAIDASVRGRPDVS